MWSWARNWLKLATSWLLTLLLPLLLLEYWLALVDVMIGLATTNMVWELALTRSVQLCGCVDIDSFWFLRLLNIVLAMWLVLERRCFFICWELGLRFVFWFYVKVNVWRRACQR
jgi:hypothetical protein